MSECLISWVRVSASVSASALATAIPFSFVSSASEVFLNASKSS